MEQHRSHSDSGRFDLLRWVKVGPGVVGRTVPVAVCLLVVLAIAVWKLNDPSVVLIVVALAVVFVSGYFCLAFWYANKHPDFSTLDGGALVDYRKTQMAARDPKIIDVDAQIVPNSAPQLEEQ